MNEEELYHGLLPDPIDTRDIPFASPSVPFDWELGFDIELLLGYRQTVSESEFFGKEGRLGWGVKRYKEIVDECKRKGIKPYKIPVKNQFQSLSCTGQGLAYYLAVLDMVETGEYREVSARDCYAYIALPNGGAYLRNACALAKDRGIATEELVKSYLSDGTTTEPFMRTKPTETDDIKRIREILRPKEYQWIPFTDRMNAIAWATLLNLGVYFGFYGENNGTWFNEYPIFPNKVAWGHAVFGGKCGVKNGQEHYEYLNSWGEACGIGGWQKLRREWFDKLVYTGMSMDTAIINPWTLTDKPNKIKPMTNVKVIKDANSPAVGFWLPPNNPDGLISMARNFGIEIPKKADGSIDWDKLIQGTLTLK